MLTNQVAYGNLTPIYDDAEEKIFPEATLVSLSGVSWFIKISVVFIAIRSKCVDLVTDQISSEGGGNVKASPAITSVRNGYCLAPCAQDLI